MDKVPDILSTISDVDTRLSRYPTISTNNGLSDDGPSAVVLVEDDLLFIGWATFCAISAEFEIQGCGTAAGSEDELCGAAPAPKSPSSR